MVFLDLHLPVWWCLVPIVIFRLFYVIFNLQKMWIMTIVKAVKNLSKNVVIKTVSNKYIWYVYSDRRDEEVNQRVNVWSNKKKPNRHITHLNELKIPFVYIRMEYGINSDVFFNWNGPAFNYLICLLFLVFIFHDSFSFVCLLFFERVFFNSIKIKTKVVVDFTLKMPNLAV